MYKIQDSNGVIMSSSDKEEVFEEFERMTSDNMVQCLSCGYTFSKENSEQVCPKCDGDKFEEYVYEDGWDGDLELIEVLRVEK